MKLVKGLGLGLAIVPGTEQGAPTKQTNKQANKIPNGTFARLILQVTPMMSCHDTDWSEQRVRQASACWEGLTLISGRSRGLGGWE